MSHSLAGREIVVCGSTSNLGPGFDTLGLALRLYVRVRIEAATDDGRGELRFDFAGAPPEGANVIEAAIRDFARLRNLALPSLHLHVASDIPMKAGLGSSAAAIVAGLRIVQSIDPAIADADLLAAATSLEGHPDNVSASLLGGLTASVQSGARVVSVATPWPAEIGIVVATPELELTTKAARAILPERVSRADAVANLQRVAVFLQALATRDFDLVRHALEDRLHQPFRAPLVPGLEAALAARHPALLGAFLSGAGPSIAALTLGDAGPAIGIFTDIYRRAGLACTVRTLDAHQPDGSRTLASDQLAQLHFR